MTQGVELRGSEELTEGNLESITELFDGGLRNGRYGAELVGGDTPLAAQIQYSFGNRLPCIHVPFLRMIYH